MDTFSSPQDASPPEDRILVSVDEDYALARVLGRGSYKVSRSLKDFSTKVIDSGSSVFLLDLQHCIGMDSTFMGVLAGVSQRQQQASGRKVMLCGVSDKLVNLMKTLGLNQLVDIQEELPDAAENEFSELSHEGESTLDSAETMLEAHEKLVEIDEGNRIKFQDVLEYLREDLQRQR